MDRYPDSIRYLIACLVAVYALADGHVLCAPCLSSPKIPCTQQECGHSPRQASGVVTSASCCSDDHEGRNPCNGNDLPAIVVQYSTDELAEFLEIHVADCVFVVPARYRRVASTDAETYTYSSAPSLRLHLLYEVLVI